MTFSSFMVDRIGASERGAGPALRAELRVKRMILDQHQGTCGGGHECLTCHLPVPCPTLRLLALPYEDHADFDPAWRVPQP